MSVWKLVLVTVLGYVQHSNALWVNTDQSSQVEFPVSDESTYFTLKTCGEASIDLDPDSTTGIQYTIYINKYNAEGLGYTTSLIQTTDADGVEEIVERYYVVYQMCNSSVSFWVSWGGGELKVGDESLGNGVIMDVWGFNGNVEHLIVGSNGVAQWHFPGVTTTSSEPVTTTASQQATTLDPSTSNTTEPTTDTDTDTDSKSSAPESCLRLRMSIVLPLCFFGSFINSS